jgi:transcriptional regulator with XRE-family HTH domain
MNLRDLRKQANMSAKEIAQKVGVTVTAIYNYERGIRSIDILMAVDMALFYGVSLDEFIEAYMNTHNQ